VALNDAAPLYRDAPEAQEARVSGDRTVQVFMQEALPEASEATRAFAGDLITTTLSAVGKQFSESSRTQAGIEAYAPKAARGFGSISDTVGVDYFLRSGSRDRLDCQSSF
jgi:Tetracyclin repressor-like, C-terminal domain